MSALDPTADAAQTTAPRVPLLRRIAQALLYGHNVDRARKTRARIGLAILCFTLIYAVIAARLVLFAVAPDSHVARRVGSSDAVATARPDILDRNGEILATDVKVPSLFAEPRRLIDVDEAVELLTAVIPDLDTSELRERLGSKRGFAWLKREVKPQTQREVHRLGIPGVGFLNENKRVYPNGREISHLIGHVNIDNQEIAGIEKWLDNRGLADLHLAGFASDRQQIRSSLRSICACNTRCATNSRLPPRSSKPRPRPASCLTCVPAKSSPWSRTQTTIRTIPRRRSTPIASTGSPPAFSRLYRNHR